MTTKIPILHLVHTWVFSLIRPFFGSAYLSLICGFRHGKKKYQGCGKQNQSSAQIV
ncbi:hypothetical protein BJX63DRAFT_413696 [Aspergillus granulosus]|uniref:Uncharacterized protein n=1 Tax=Aspergillus granulosus TaxID=176169 RepID=A0ABR4GUZ1_9EURO